MGLYPISLLINLFVLSLSMNIIKDLPYNIYQIEDMNKYENKYLPEGSKFYIKFPSNSNKSTKFYLTIPRNIKLFPIYSSEFAQRPSDEEIINTDFKNELQLKNREDQEYSIYTFDIENSDSYKVLYFQNNEILKYLSFYALSSTEPVIQKLKYDSISTFKIVGNISYFFRVELDPSDEDLLIKIKKGGDSKASLKLDILFSRSYLDDDKIINIDNNWQKNVHYETEDEYNYYYIENSDEVAFLTIHLLSDKDINSLEISVEPDGGFPTWLLVIIIIIALIIVSCCCTFCSQGAKDCGHCLNCACKCGKLC